MPETTLPEATPVVSVPVVTETAADTGAVVYAEPAQLSRVAALVRNPLIWPVMALVALLVIDVIANPSFLTIRMQDGHLYGNLIDILRNGAPVLLVALGMTLVIATRGIDLSVGAVAAIAAAIACVYIAGLGPAGSGEHGDRGLQHGARRVRGARPVERVPGRGARHPAHHRHTRADDRRARARDAGHRRADHHGQQRHFRRHRGRASSRRCRSPSWSRWRSSR